MDRNLTGSRCGCGDRGRRRIRSRRRPATGDGDGGSGARPGAAQLPALAATAVSPTVSPETLYVPVQPCRIVDTRAAGGALGNGEVRSFVVGGSTGFVFQGGTSGGCGIPSDATAVSMSVSAISPSAAGYLRGWPYGTVEPAGGTFLNYNSSGSATTGTTQAVTPNAAKGWTVHNFGTRTHFAVDVTGYYVPQIEGYVGGDGSLQTGTSRIVDVVHSGTGSYYVDLDRNARSCSIQATAYNLYRYASVGYSSSTTPNRVSVYIWYLNGTTPTPVDYPFHVLVSC